MKEPGNEDTVLLHFTAGPPYEDIAFRIVNKEWEFSHKRYAPSPIVLHALLMKAISGFRSSFDRGCLSLWFNYRRNVSDLVLLLATVLSLLSSIANNFVLYYLY